MKKRLSIWAKRVIATGTLMVLILGVLVLYPNLLHAHNTVAQTDGYTIYHQNEIDLEAIDKILGNVDQALKKSEFYDESYTFSLCIDDGSSYNGMMASLIGDAFGSAHASIVTLYGNVDWDANRIEKRGYYWELTELLTHELTHSLQFKTLGLMNTNPIASHPHWKWEGYPEYIARQGADAQDLSVNLQRLNAVLETEHNGWITFDNGTGMTIDYYKDWCLVKYCMDIEGMSYVELLSDGKSREYWQEKMMIWYQG